MKTYNNLYSEITSFENLYLAFQKAKKYKRYKKGVGEFEYNLEKELFQIKRDLEFFNYKPSKPKKFILKDPKKRIIHAVSFRDRVIHHALCNIIEPIFDKRFIYDSYACRKERGTHKAISRLDSFIKKVSKNDTKQVYVLKMDIKKYFDNINHKILLEIIKKKIKDKNTIWLISIIIDNYHKNKEQGEIGIPIGNLTSQLFANIYLNELDYFIKEKLNIKYYIRYMDDFVILDTSFSFLLKIKEKIDIFINENLKLNLHPDKTRILKLNNGILFLGYRIFYYYKLLKKGNVKRFNKNLIEMKNKYKNQIISIYDIGNSLISCLGHIKYTNSYNLRRLLFKDLIFLIND